MGNFARKLGVGVQEKRAPTSRRAGGLGVVVVVVGANDLLGGGGPRGLS